MRVRGEKKKYGRPTSRWSAAFNETLANVVKIGYVIDDARARIVCSIAGEAKDVRPIVSENIVYLRMFSH